MKTVGLGRDVRELPCRTTPRAVCVIGPAPPPQRGEMRKQPSVLRASGAHFISGPLLPIPVRRDPRKRLQSSHGRTVVEAAAFEHRGRRRLGAPLVGPSDSSHVAGGHGLGFLYFLRTVQPALLPLASTDCESDHRRVCRAYPGRVLSAGAGVVHLPSPTLASPPHHSEPASLHFVLHRMRIRPRTFASGCKQLPRMRGGSQSVDNRVTTGPCLVFADGVAGEAGCAPCTGCRLWGGRQRPGMSGWEVVMVWRCD